MRRRILSFPEWPFQRERTGEECVPAGYSVAIIGAGSPGIAMGVQLARLDIPFTIYERRSEIGGVWSINTYPDVRVDTLSASYEYSFEKKYPWTEFFASQSEVRGVSRPCRTQARRVRAHRLRRGRDVRAVRRRRENVGPDGGGGGAVADDRPWPTSSWPRAESLRHRANCRSRVPRSSPVGSCTPREWDDSIDYAGKERRHHRQRLDRCPVAVEGCERGGVRNGLSADPAVDSPRAKYGEAISDELQWLFQAMPFYWNWNKYIAGFASNDLRELLIADEQWIADGGVVNKRNDAMREMLVGYIRDQVNDREDLIEKLVPDYPPMTRRPVVDNQWYASLTRDNVELVTTPIERLTPFAVQTSDGTVRDADLIIAAVGFQTEKFLWPTEYVGADGANLEEVWTVQGAQAHLGMTVPGFPNLFMLYGPNSQPVASGAGLPIWLETWCGYIAEGILAMLDNGYASMEIRREAFDHYNEQLHKEACRLIYLSQTSTTRKNYYVNQWGRLQISAPWDGEEYFAMCVHPRLSDFDFASAE
ncbi:NAD(P)-binding protein [Rhodococcus hoagii]|nr:NAD(P)-binding protein [Prescottella equi]